MSKMTAEEFMALPSRERKKLAARRSLDRSEARKAGKPVPPTLTEEFGIQTKRGRPGGSRNKPKKSDSKQKVEKKSDPKPKAKPKVQPDSLIRSGVVKSGPRTIAGYFHSVRGGDDSGEKAAKKAGHDKELAYRIGGREEGKIFYKTLPQEDRERIRTILAGHHLGNTVYFEGEGKK